MIINSKDFFLKRSYKEGRKEGFLKKMYMIIIVIIFFILSVLLELNICILFMID